MSAIAALLLLASPADGAVEAERAFAEMAQTEGQWTAFRAFAAEGAVMFTPNPVDAHTALDGLENPPVAVRWWPARSFVSCDGSMVVNTGPWVRPGPRHGYFVTVWERQEDGSWRWRLDDGQDLAAPIPAGEEPAVRQASCADLPQRFRRPAVAQAGPVTGGASPDGTLRWSWQDRGSGGTRLEIRLFDGDSMDSVFVHDRPVRIP
ncbi:MAG: hypothetical protein ACTS1X_02915 [Parasphingopyxis sp.]|uniref:hypothetical protein n=1 Tax=Parasphingopyxis sp. TaxID=1920299 RepID=UPI003F9FD2B8